MHIRKARACDVSDLVALETSAFAADRLSRRAIRYMCANPQADIFVYDDNGIIGAVISLRHARARLGRLYSLAVSPNAEGRGIASALLSHAESECVKPGLKLEVRMDNEKARNMYLRRGYVQTGVKSKYYEDGMDAAIMVKMLPNANPKAL